MQAALVCRTLASGFGAVAGGMSSCRGASGTASPASSMEMGASPSTAARASLTVRMNARVDMPHVRREGASYIGIEEIRVDDKEDSRSGGDGDARRGPGTGCGPGARADTGRIVQP